MPQLSPTTGRILSGMGGAVTNIAINGVQVPSLTGYAAGSWGWLGEDLIAGQGNNGVGGGNRIYQVIVSTDTLSQIDSQGANIFAAGGGNGAAFLVGSGVRPVKGATFVTQTLAGLNPGDQACAGVDVNGVVVMVQNYQAGRGLQPFAANGSPLPTIDIRLAGQHVSLREGLISACDTQGTWHLYTAATGLLARFAARTDDTTIYRIIPVTIGGVLYVVEVANSQTTIRPATSNMGFVLQRSAIEFQFGVDAREQSPGVARVAWCTNAAESHLSCRCVDFTTATGSGSFGTTASGALVFGAATTLTPATFTIGPVQGGGLSVAGTLPQHEPVDKNPQKNLMSDAWYGALLQLLRAATGPIDMSRLSGILSQQQGGTGGTGGLNSLNGQNLIPGSVDITALVPQELAWLLAQRGLPGEDGADGDPGAPGVPGPQGPAGAPGATGPAGVSMFGADGADGEDGIGFPGPPGPQGPTGATGATGPAGVSVFGADGEDGIDGIGFPGPQGPQGPTGPTGPAGAIGAAGVPGADGEDGQDGSPGPPGPVGATGPQGLQGATGPTGVGIPGTDGEDGMDGLPGAPGLAGPTGATGAAGTNGTQPEELLALVAGAYKRIHFLEDGLGVEYPTTALDSVTNDEMIALEEIDLLVNSASAAAVTRSLGITIDGGGSVITPGIKGDLYVPYACQLLASTIIADQTGSIVLNVWVTSSYATIPTSVNDITAANPPTLSAASSRQDSALSNWTRSIAAGSRIRWNVVSAATVTRVTHQLTAMTI